MEYQVLARKWRPAKFEDVIGQSHVTTSLQNSIKNNRVGHAYIFSGTRGIGKTSVARIFAKALRCLNSKETGNPCHKCEACEDFDGNSSMNVIEIDGASNNKVEDIRDLVGNVQFLPTVGDYKVYIIDEVHMLTTSAFNALLKTLEEPPKHVVFIFATTEPEKLLGTVLSRCQRFDFRNATVADLVERLKLIGQEEGIKFDNDNLIEQICIQGNGSVRDTLSLLDQVLSFSIDQHITEEVLLVSLGLAKLSSTKELTTAILEGDVDNLRKVYHGVLSENVSLENLCQSLVDYLFQVINGEVEHDLGQVGRAELYWVFETLVRDLEWALTSIAPVKVVQIALQKLTERSSFFSSDQTIAIPEKKNTNLIPTDEVVEKPMDPVVEEEPVQPVGNDLAGRLTQYVNDPDLKIEDALEQVEPVKEESNVPVEEVVPVETTEVEEEEAPKKEYAKTWDGFLEYFSSVSAASASNLEQGNILSNPEFDIKAPQIEIAYPAAAKLFYDYVSENEIKEKITKNLADFLGIQANDVNLNIRLLDDEEKSKLNFMSRAEIEENKIEEKLKAKEDTIRNNPLIKKAEELFSSNIDKVLVNKED